jgi:hypothetical protein
MSKIKMCLASKYNNCSGGISGEHYISKSILNLSSIDDKVEISGLPWIEPNTFEKIGINSLTANILCTKHNNDLSIYDAEILKLFKAFAEIDNHFNKSCFLDVNEIKIDGNKIEKWMLKTCLGLIASKQISKNDKREELVIKDLYLDILFNDKKIPDNCGLYFKIPNNRMIRKHNGFSFIPQTANCELKSAEFWINNFAFNFIIVISRKKCPCFGSGGCPFSVDMIKV